MEGIEVDSKPSRVASRVWELSAKGNGTEANKDWRLLAASLQKVGLAASSASSQYLPLKKKQADHQRSIYDIKESKSESKKHTLSHSCFLVHLKYPNAPEPQGCTMP